MPLINWVGGQRGRRMRVATWRLPVWALASWWLVRGAGHATAALVRWWRLVVPAAGLACLWRDYGPVAVLALLATAGVAGGVWWRADPGSFWRWVGLPLLGRWRRVWVYSRRWAAAMTTTGLGSGVALPRLVVVRCGWWTDRLMVGLLPGQTPGDFAAVAARLAHTFRVLSVRAVLTARPDRVMLICARADRLVNLVPAYAPEPVPDLDGLVVGRREDGRAWRLRLSGTHVLIAGATGSGKSALLWALLAALAGGIRSGLVQVWAVDPKGGMELAAGRPLFARFAYTGEEQIADLLEQAVAVMRERADRLRGHTRAHTPSRDDPTIVVVADELAAVTAYAADRKVRDRVRAALSLLLSQGRAVGLHVIAAVQDPRKETVPFRDLFPTRVALRMTEPEQTDLVLGDGARLRGAVCDQIPTSQPGVGYVLIDGDPEPVRVRASLWPDTYVTSLVHEYSTGQDAP